MASVSLPSATDSRTAKTTFISTSTFTETATETATSPPSILGAPSTIPLIAVIASALIALFIIIISAMAWWIFKRRVHRKNATHPKKPEAPSYRDCESQVQEDSDVEGATTSHPKPTTKRHTASSNTNTQSDKNTNASNVHNKTTSLTSHIPHVKTGIPSQDDSNAPRRQTSTTSSSSQYLPPMPPASPSASTFRSMGNVLSPQGVDVVQHTDNRHTGATSAVRLLPMDIHIDRVDMDMESLLPIVISDEIEPAAILRLQQLLERQQLEQQVQAEMPLKETAPSVLQPASAVATPSLRRPAFVSRKSTDSYSSGRPRMSTSSSHPPPPPPPTIPPPAIPVSVPGGHASNHRNHSDTSNEALAGPSIHDPSPSGQLAYIRGRHPRASTETESYSTSSAHNVRRSISIDSSARCVEDQDGSVSPKGRVSTSSQRSYQSMHPPPNTPPPPPPDATDLSQPTQSIQRRRHQKKPSQILSPCFFTIAESSSTLPAISALSPLSPLSPPLSPLAIQVPRPSSRSYVHGPSSSSGRGTPGSATYGRASNESPVPRLTYTPKSNKTPAPAPAPQVGPSQVQHRRARSRSISQAETCGLSSNVFPTPSVVSEAPTSAPSLPLKQEIMASATQSYLLLRRPSMVLNHQQQPQPLPFSSMNPAAAAPLESDPCHSSPKHRRRRSRSLSSGRDHSSSSLFSFSSTLEGLYHADEGSVSEERSSKGDDERFSSVGSVRDSDLELQSIIADARVIAAAKCAAIKAARESSSSRYRQSYYQKVYGFDSPSLQPLGAAAAALSGTAPGGAYTSAAVDDATTTGGFDRDHWGNIMPVSGPSTGSSSRAESPFYP
ncbi:unnamed protein product [Mortierella alpina]